MNKFNFAHIKLSIENRTPKFGLNLLMVSRAEKVTTTSTSCLLCCDSAFRSSQLTVEGTTFENGSWTTTFK